MIDFFKEIAKGVGIFDDDCKFGGFLKRGNEYIFSLCYDFPVGDFQEEMCKMYFRMHKLNCRVVGRTNKENKGYLRVLYTTNE